MGLISQAKNELKRINFGEEDSAVMIDLLERFFAQWDSGGAVYAVAPVLQRLIAGKCLSPLTGEDDEWFIHDCDGMYAQNLRCSTVFRREKGGPAIDIDAADPNAPITFPYWPDRADVPSPVIEIET